jgi:large-conductance mechanosensitive channel
VPKNWINIIYLFIYFTFLPIRQLLKKKKREKKKREEKRKEKKRKRKRKIKEIRKGGGCVSIFFTHIIDIPVFLNRYTLVILSVFYQINEEEKRKEKEKQKNKEKQRKTKKNKREKENKPFPRAQLTKKYLCLS